jgi:hypothetical protein
VNYRIIYNQDSTNLFAITREPIAPRHVDRMVDEVAAGGADVMLINPNAQRVNYPSRVWQTFWDGYVPGKRDFFGPVPDAEVSAREAWVVQMKNLADQGCDYLTRALARCRQRGIVPGVSVRMNDMHDAPTPGTHLFSRFYMEHLDLRLDNGPACGWGARGLDYTHAAVRAHYLALIREVVTEYDVEVLELDFLRFHCYFPRQHFAENAGIMTEFLREVRSTLAGTGRQVALMARVPATPAAAYELGFDVAAWAREGLVTGISAGAFLNTQWAIAVDEFKALVGRDIAVFACTDYTADRRPELPVRAMPTDPLLLRGFAAGHLATGADGVELFNFFCAREQCWEKQPLEPAFATLRDMRSLAALRAVPKSYTVTAGWAVGQTDGPTQVPVTAEPGQPRLFQMLLAAEPDSVCVEAVVVFTGGGATQTDQLWLQVNHVPAGPAQSVRTVPGNTKGVRQAVFAVPVDALRDGRNTLVLRNEGEALTVISLDIQVSRKIGRTVI